MTILNLCIFIFPILYLTSITQFGPLCLLCTEELPVVFLHAKDQYINQSFYTVFVLPDEGVSDTYIITVNAIKFRAFVCLCYNS
jgi:hypothetical protein